MRIIRIYLNRNKKTPLAAALHQILRTSLIAFCASVIALLLATGCARGPDQPAECVAVRQDLDRLLSASWTDVPRASGLAAMLLAVRLSIERQLVPHDEWVALGWCAYREGDFATADRAFMEAMERVRHSGDGSLGRGQVALRRDRPGEAVHWFGIALERTRGSAEAADGLQWAIERLPSGDLAAAAALAAVDAMLRRRPDDEGWLHLRAAADRKAGGAGEFRRRPDAAAGPLHYFARAGEDYLEIRQPGGEWQALYIKGVNIGPALPGRYPAEAPRDEATWREWLADIAALGANAVRIYTLQPPAFYQALAAHNAADPAGHLWLLQGVWTELPPGDDFDDPDYLAGFHAEIERVIDAVHGDLVLAAERGHADGVYDTNVSEHTLAWIIGREWEPFAVVAYDAMHPGACRHDGRFVTVAEGRAMECWIGRSLDHAAAYEARRHGAGRPLTFANWPTLDPLNHPTEANRAEEDRWRLELDGVPLPERVAPAWDDDAISVDATLLERTDRFAPGVFASYHVYPNFPYFMNLDPSFAETTDALGVNRYAGYLQALKAYHGTQPVLVAEFGMSTSRGIAHLQPEGLHHGGQHEPEAMRQVARLAHSIHDAGMAGGLVFEFMDEWFKGTWSTSPFEVPEHRRAFWFNAESPEQSYGLWAARPAAPVRLSGRAGDWQGVARLSTPSAPEPDDGWRSLRGLRAAHDAGYLYLLLETAGYAPPDWDHVHFAIGIDTYAVERGERALPSPASCDTATGIEFAALLRGPEGSVLQVSAPYRLRHPAESGAAGTLVSPVNPSGRFEAPSLTTNRERFTRAGERVPPRRVEPGRLRFGSLDPAAPDFDTRVDVVVGAADGVIELRVPWGLLNFADPSAARVLHQPQPGAMMGTAATDGLRLYACAWDPRDPSRTSRLPAAGEAAPVFELDRWEQPEYRLEPKHGLDQLADALRALPAWVRPGAAPAENAP